MFNEFFLNILNIINEMSPNTDISSIDILTTPLLMILMYLV